MPKWIIKHTGPHGPTDVAYISHQGSHISCNLGNGLSAALGYAGLRTDEDYAHRHTLLHMEVDQALAYLQSKGTGTYEVFSSEKTWADRLDEHIKVLREMGCAVVVLTPEDIQTQGPHDDNDEPLVTLEQAETWLRFHRRDVEEAILGDYWGDTISAVMDFHPIGTKTDPGPTIKLNFNPQAWVNDWAMSVDPEGDTTWEVPKDEFLKQFPTEQDFHDQDYCRDHLRFEGTAPKWVRDWSGPFEVELVTPTEEIWETADA